MINPCFALFTSCIISSLTLMTNATIQERDELRWGGARFKLSQYPLERLIQEKEKQLGHGIFRPIESTNLKGYRASWVIDNNKLYLTKFEGNGDRGLVDSSLIGLEDELPVLAVWYTGELLLPIGDSDSTTEAYPLVMRLTIEKGVLIKLKIQYDTKWSSNGDLLDPNVIPNPPNE